MKKRFAFALLILFAALLLSGCHGSRDMSSFLVPSEFDTSRDFEITFWAKNDTNQNQTAIYQKAIAGFESLYPNIRVNMRLYTDYSRIYNDVITNIATKTTPNVCVTYPDHIATYLTGDNVVAPLDELFADGKYGFGGSELRFDAPGADEIVPQFLNECRIGGHYYAVPFMRSTEALYINKTYVEKLGYTIPDVVTWDFVWEVSDAATEKDADGNYLLNGQKVMIPFIYKSTDNMMIQMLRQKNAGYSTDAGEVLIFNDTAKALLETVAEHVKKGAFSTFKISSYPANFLNAGQCLFAVDSTAGATWMGSDAPLLDISPEKLVPFETVIRPVPQFDTENLQMISQGPSVCVFNKDDPQEVLASWLFVQYLLSNDVQIAYSETEGYVPVTTKAQNAPEYADYLAREGEDGTEHYFVKIQAAKLLIEHVNETFVTPVFNGSASLRDAVGQMIEEVTKGVRRKKDVNGEFIQNLYEDMASLYHLNQIGAENGKGKAELGPLPTTSVLLLASLAIVWVILGAYGVFGVITRKKH